MSPLKQYTVCLYDGSVTSIDNIVATKEVWSDGIDSFDHIALFYDFIEGNEDYKVYKNRITKKDFTVYYERTILLKQSKIHTYDFGSYTRFIAIFEGKYKAEELPTLLKTAREEN